MPQSQKKRLSDENLRAILDRQTPLLDVRAQVEFDQGALPNACNIAILNDDERARVGTAYKQDGSEAANALGHQLVSGNTKRTRVDAWKTFLDANPSAKVMCWRGGQRSQIAQRWLADQGYTVDRVAGGYKALRNLCLEVLDQTPLETKPWWVVAGRTGVQKTVLIKQLACSIDLEHIAHHRGSAFGAHNTPQPAPASFENSLAYSAVNHAHPILVLEDESRLIGRLALPNGWHERMKKSPLALIEASLEARVDHIVAEYVTESLARGDERAVLEARYRSALQRISRRLGGVLHQKIDTLIAQAFADTGSHQAWVHALLSDYYDPMYDYQLSTKNARVKFRGSLDEVSEFLAARNK